MAAAAGRGGHPFLVDRIDDLGHLLCLRVVERDRPRLGLSEDLFGALFLVEDLQDLLDCLGVGRVGPHDERVQPRVGDDLDRAGGCDRSAAAQAEQGADQAARVAERRPGQVAQHGASAGAPCCGECAAAEDLVQRLGRHGRRGVHEPEHGQIAGSGHRAAGQRGQQVLEVVECLDVFRGDHDAAGARGHDDLGRLPGRL